MKFTEKDLTKFMRFLEQEELSKATIERYLQCIKQFLSFVEGKKISKNTVIDWKDSLLKLCFTPRTVNIKIVAINKFFKYKELDYLCIKNMPIQRKVFCSIEKELTLEDYKKLVFCAIELGKHRTALIIETLCSTGIRVSEIYYVTLDAVTKGRVEISMKNKTRTILIPEKLKTKLIEYSKKKNIITGQIFTSKTGSPLSRIQIWADLKYISKKSGIEETKIYPHNLRHLFARTFYNSCRDIVKLADILGHSTVDTTRIYLISTGEEHKKLIDSLDLIL